MGKRRIPTTTIFIGREDADRRSAPAGLGPYVGIWWAKDRRIAAMLQVAAEIRASSPLVDCDLEHLKAWSAVAAHFGRREADNYFDVPRGRVLWSRETDCGIIYHGNETQPATLKRIAKLYGLIKWNGHIDEHYLMGDEADALFDSDTE
jgi:hypothetical protein